jgi:hypothetical protein
MTPVSTMVCDLCNEQASETLITRARWERFEGEDQETRYVCPSCAVQHGRRRQELMAVLEQEDRRASQAGRSGPGGERSSFVRTLLDSILGR